MKELKIVMIPMCRIDERMLLEVKEHIEKIYSFKVEVIFFEQDLNFAYNKKRNQYLAEHILQEARKIKKWEHEKWILIVDVDLYHPNSNFVFGLACPNSGISIISLTRLRQEYYGITENKKLFFERVKKMAIHELGHLFYLDNCHNKKCVMRCSYPIDEKESFLCESCKRFLQYRLKGYKYSLLLYILWHA